MLITPFGNIDIQFDGLTARYDQIAIKPPKQCEDVDACHLLNFYYQADGKPHVLECKIEGVFKDAFPETGERLECMSFYTESGKLSLGCEASFGDNEDYGYDFDGDLVKNGICIAIFPETKSQTFSFAVSWMTNYTKGHDYQTWYGADPWLLKQSTEKHF